MRHKKQIVISLVAFLTYAIFTGGLAISIERGMSCQSNIQLAMGLKSDIYLAPRITKWGIPFVVHYYGTNKPYALRLQIWDDSKSYASIEVDEVGLKYADGEIVRKTDRWARKLEPFTQHNSSSSGKIIRTEMMMLSSYVENLVLRNEDVTISMKGRLLKKDGESVNFSVSENFEARSRVKITTFWDVLAGL